MSFIYEGKTFLGEVHRIDLSETLGRYKFLASCTCGWQGRDSDIEKLKNLSGHHVFNHTGELNAIQNQEAEKSTEESSSV